MKLLPGIRLSVNKDSVGMSFGVPGARYTINSKGRRTVSTGIPGTGLYNVETLSSGKRSSRSTSTQTTSSSEEINLPYSPPASMQPGLFARKAERALYAYLRDIFKWDETDTPDQAIEKATTLQVLHPTLNHSLSLMKFLYCVKGSSLDDSTSYEWGTELWSNRHVAFSDKYVRKYFQGITPQVQITNGILTSSVYNAQTLGHIYVELLQHMGKFDEAFAILHEMEPDQLVAISLADLEICTKDYDGAIETTEDIENEDDATAMMLILRGVAFREKGLPDASLECFKRALASKKRAEVLRHRALFERAETYSVLGKKALAIKDLEKILVDDSDYPAVQEKLEKLKG
jgi:tetratricopeptide (TPR) repeat protein